MYFKLFTTKQLEIILNLSHLDVHTYMHSYNTTCINLHKNTAMIATTMALNKMIFHGDISVIYKYKDHTYTSQKQHWKQKMEAVKIHSYIHTYVGIANYMQ